MSDAEAVIILNPRAGSGRAGRCWDTVATALDRIGYRYRLCSTDDTASAARAIQASHEPVIVAAGGDGTVHAVANLLLQHRPQALLGCIALGSSNDAHKPVSSTGCLAGIAVRLDDRRAQRRDVIVLRQTLPDGLLSTRCCLLNASLGFVAAGNHRFNHPGTLLAALKRRSTDAAIAAIIGQQLLRLRPLDLYMQIDNRPVCRLRCSNCALMKSNHFAGDLHFDLPLRPDDGRLGLALWRSIHPLGVALALTDALRGRFHAGPSRQACRARLVRISSAVPFAVEADGEVIFANRLTAQAVPRILACCGPGPPLPKSQAADQERNYNPVVGP